LALISLFFLLSLSLSLSRSPLSLSHSLLFLFSFSPTLFSFYCSARHFIYFIFLGLKPRAKGGMGGRSASFVEQAPGGRYGSFCCQQTASRCFPCVVKIWHWARREIVCVVWCMYILCVCVCVYVFCVVGAVFLVCFGTALSFTP